MAANLKYQFILGHSLPQILRACIKHTYSPVHYWQPRNSLKKEQVDERKHTPCTTMEEADRIFQLEPSPELDENTSQKCGYINFVLQHNGIKHPKLK